MIKKDLSSENVIQNEINKYMNKNKYIIFLINRN